MVCRYCRAPVEALDPDAVARTVQALQAAEQRRATIDVGRLAEALLAHPAAAMPPGSVVAARAPGLDLIGAGIALVVSALSGD
jgi:hypothetical protein